MTERVFELLAGRQGVVIPDSSDCFEAAPIPITSSKARANASQDNAVPPPQQHERTTEYERERGGENEHDESFQSW